MTVNASEVKLVLSPLRDATYDARLSSGASAAYVKATGTYTPAKITLAWNNPNGNESVHSRYLFAHSSFASEYPLTVVGGSPPYKFELVGANNPTGTTLTPKTPSGNTNLVLWALVTVPANTGGTVTARCIDQDLNMLYISWTIAVDDAKWVIVDPVSGTPGGAGTWADPIDDLDTIYTTDVTDTTWQNNFIACKTTGTLTVSNFDIGIAAYRLGDAKPKVILGVPGVTCTLDADVNIATNTGSTDDFFIYNVVHDGADVNEAQNRFFVLAGGQTRGVFGNINFSENPSGSVGNDNNACIYGPASAGGHTNISLCGITSSNHGSGTSGVAQFIFYNLFNSSVDGSIATNADGSELYWFKGRFNNVSMRGVNAYETADNTTSASSYTKGSRITGQDGEAADVGEMCYSKIFKATDGVFGDQAFTFGHESTADWGTVHVYRCTLVGSVDGAGGGSWHLNGTANLDDCVIVNDDSPKVTANIAQSGNVEYGRSEINTVLNTSGRLTSSARSLYLDTKGHEVG